MEQNTSIWKFKNTKLLHGSTSAEHKLKIFHVWMQDTIVGNKNM